LIESSLQAFLACSVKRRVSNHENGARVTQEDSLGEGVEAFFVLKPSGSGNYRILREELFYILEMLELRL